MRDKFVFAAFVMGALSMAVRVESWMYSGMGTKERSGR